MNKSSPRNSTTIVVGRNPLCALIHHAPQLLLRLLVTPNGQKYLEDGGLISPEFEIEEVKNTYLDQYGNHQGVGAVVKLFPPKTLKELVDKVALDRKPRILVAPLGVTDPQNLGAIYRSVECFGGDGVMLPQDRTASLNSTVVKVSSGASLLVPTYQGGNISQFIERLKELDFWSVAASVDMSVKDSPKQVALSQFTFPRRTILILGSEGSGVPQQVLRHADFHLYIPMCGTLDSLNVAQAATIFLHIYRQVTSD
jgi:23S rRNA (guanosine2251-2'-O)-methyltransferase